MTTPAVTFRLVDGVEWVHVEVAPGNVVDRPVLPEDRTGPATMAHVLPTHPTTVSVIPAAYQAWLKAGRP
jgi:hypothetical protein